MRGREQEREGGKEQREKNRPVVGESESETMSSGSLGVREGWLRCVLKGEK